MTYEDLVNPKPVLLQAEVYVAGFGSTTYYGGEVSHVPTVDKLELKVLTTNYREILEKILVEGGIFKDVNGAEWAIPAQQILGIKVVSVEESSWDTQL